VGGEMHHDDDGEQNDFKVVVTGHATLSSET
jgi:hypothetical protein